jgi:hypothetical protein
VHVRVRAQEIETSKQEEKEGERLLAHRQQAYCPVKQTSNLVKHVKHVAAVVKHVVKHAKRRNAVRLSVSRV